MQRPSSQCILRSGTASLVEDLTGESVYPYADRTHIQKSVIRLQLGIGNVGDFLYRCPLGSCLAPYAESSKFRSSLPKIRTPSMHLQRLSMRLQETGNPTSCYPHRGFITCNAGNFTPTTPATSLLHKKGGAYAPLLTPPTDLPYDDPVGAVARPYEEQATGGKDVLPPEGAKETAGDVVHATILGIHRTAYDL